MTPAVSLERLEAEFSASLVCLPCAQANQSAPATHVAILRRFCAAGAPIAPRADGREWLVCEEHALALATMAIGAAERGTRSCSACGSDVTRQTYAHVLARVEPIGLPR